MEPIGTHGLSCLNDQDWADYARYMQCQAEAIDAALFEQMTAFEDLLSRPTMIVRAQVARSFAAGTRSDLFDQVVYLNNDFMSLSPNATGTETYINIGSRVGFPVVPYPRGMYAVGISVPFDATGAVTAFSERRVALSVLDDTIPPAQTQLAFAYDVCPDAATTIVNVVASANLSVVLRGTHGVRVANAVSHTNAASTVLITPANETLWWVTYLGPEELVEAS